MFALAKVGVSGAGKDRDPNPRVTSIRHKAFLGD